MKFLLFAPLIIAIVFFVVILMVKKKPLNEPFKQKLLWVGVGCCIISIIAVLISVYLSGNKIQLLTLSCPAIILIIAIEQIRQSKKSGKI